MLLVVVGAACAHAEVRLEATLAPLPDAPAAARGLAVLTLLDDGTVRWQLRVSGMSGFATSTVLRAGAAGPPVVTLTNPPATGDHVGTFGPLDAAAQAALSDGQWYVHVATAAHSDGELQGRVAPAAIAGVTCACAAAASARAFRACVKSAVRQLPASRRRSAAVKAMRRAARSAACGPLPGRAPKKAIACCLPRTPAENVVVERLCAPLPPASCLRRGGREAGTTCAVDLCEAPA